MVVLGTVTMTREDDDDDVNDMSDDVSVSAGVSELMSLPTDAGIVDYNQQEIKTNTHKRLKQYTYTRVGSWGCCRFWSLIFS